MAEAKKKAKKTPAKTKSAKQVKPKAKPVEKMVESKPEVVKPKVEVPIPVAKPRPVPAKITLIEGLTYNVSRFNIRFEKNKEVNISDPEIIAFCKKDPRRFKVK